MNKYVIIRRAFNNVSIDVYDDMHEWHKKIDNLAITGCYNGEFEIAIYNVEFNEEITTDKVKIFGTQGRRDSIAYVSSIPEEWGQPIFTDRIEYIHYYEENGKYIACSEVTTEEYESYEEMFACESPSQYIQ